MAVTATPVFVQNPKIGKNSLTNSDSANTKKTVVTAGSNGTKVTGLFATSTETANARVLQLWLTRSAVSTLIGTINVPLNSGFDGTVAQVNLLSRSMLPGLPLDNDGQPYIFLENADTLDFSATTQVASGKQVDVHAIHGSF